MLMVNCGWLIQENIRLKTIQLMANFEPGGKPLPLKLKVLADAVTLHILPFYRTAVLLQVRKGWSGSKYTNHPESFQELSLPHQNLLKMRMLRILQLITKAISMLWI